MKRKVLVALLVIAMLGGAIVLYNYYFKSPTEVSEELPLKVDSPELIAQCAVRNSLPDPQCTPGAVFKVSIDEICSKGYSAKVRKVSNKTKAEVYKRYGITSHQPGQYEVDHLIPLALGGSNDPENLWPESSNPKPGCHEKDVVENYLHREVCAGRMALPEAQKEIKTNWLEVYQQIRRK